MYPAKFIIWECLVQIALERPQLCLHVVNLDKNSGPALQTVAGAHIGLYDDASYTRTTAETQSKIFQHPRYPLSLRQIIVLVKLLSCILSAFRNSVFLHFKNLFPRRL